MLLLKNLSVDDSVYDFCTAYVAENPPDRQYDNNNLFEWYPKISHFKSNFEFKSMCIGKLPNGFLSEHVDDGRESALVIPVSPEYLVMTFDSSNSYKIEYPFIIDTTKNHGVITAPDSLFMTIDFYMSFEKLHPYIMSYDFLTLGMV